MEIYVRNRPVVHRKHHQTKDDSSAIVCLNEMSRLQDWNDVEDCPLLLNVENECHKVTIDIMTL